MGSIIITKYILDDLKSLTDKEKSFKSYLETKDTISFNELPEEIKNSFSKIPKINKIYKCKKCGKIANFYKSSKKYTQDLFIHAVCEEEHSFILDYCDFPIQINSYLNLTEIKEEINKKNNNDIFNKLSKENIFFLIKLIKLYNNIKDKIKEKNFGDTKNNLGFTLFENLLSNYIYNNDNENKGFNNLQIYNLNFNTNIYNYFINSKYFELYNQIQELPNGTKFILKKSIQIPLDTNPNFFDIDEYLNFYQLCENFYCFKDTREHTMVIKGYLGNLQFNNTENETKIYNLYDDKIIFNDKKIINSYIEDLKYMIDKKNIIYIDNDLLIGVKPESIYLINSNLHLLSYEIFNFNFNDYIDYIYKIISLKNNPIKTILKNKEDVQFLLIGKKNIFLFEYIKNKKSVEFIKNYNYTKKEFCLPSYNYLFYKNTLFFYEKNEPYLFIFNLNSFQLETIININKIVEGFYSIISLNKKNKYEIDILIKTKNEIILLLLNMKNKKIKIDATTETKIVYVEDYYPNNYFMCLSNNHYFLNKENDAKYFKVFGGGSSDIIDTRKSCIININKKEFAVFAFNYCKNEKFSAYIDIYQFI